MHYIMKVLFSLVAATAAAAAAAADYLAQDIPTVR
jgi:hypothetical protein